MEEWKSYNKEYQVSNLGNVRKIKKNKIYMLKPEIIKKGYLRVSIWENGKRNRKLVHRLVAETFIPNIDNKPQVDHINNITSDNRVENLRWVTPKENVQHSIEQNRFMSLKRQHSDKTKWDNMSEETKQKQLDRLKKINIGREPWNKGKKGLQHHTEEWKQKASERMKEYYKKKHLKAI